MIKRLLFALFLMAYPLLSFCQPYDYQYFDGADTLPYSHIVVNIDTTGGNVWQIGRPQKTIFDSAATYPNVIVTDTINSYPINDSSSFIVRYNPTYSWGVYAVRWKQKLDLDKKNDGGIVEYSLDTGATWHNIFNNPYVYNLYGFDSSNKDTLVSGEYAFSGTDTVWRDIWLCFDYSFLSLSDSVMFRFTLKSDSVDSAKEGWMIDNMMMHITMVHGLIVDKKNESGISVFPNVTTGRVNIEAKRVERFHIIERMQLINIEGKVLQEHSMVPIKYYLDLSDYPNGTYYLKIKTNLYSGTFPIVLSK